MIPFFYMSYMKKRFSIPFGFEKRFLLFCIDVPILIRPGAVTIVCVSDPICVTIIIISVCCFYYINSTVTALKFMLFQLVSEMITFVIPGTI